MPEISTPVQTVIVQYMCDDCGEEMRGAGYYQLTSPPRYPHVCSNGHKMILDKLYPSTETRPLDAAQ